MMKCFACDKPLKHRWFLAATMDGQRVFVGSECWRKVMNWRYFGYYPPKGGPKIRPLELESVLFCKSHGAVKCTACGYDAVKQVK